MRLILVLLLHSYQQTYLIAHIICNPLCITINLRKQTACHFMKIIYLITADRYSIVYYFTRRQTTIDRNTLLYYAILLSLYHQLTYLIQQLKSAENIKTLSVKTNSVAQEPEGSSRHSQQPATGPCPEPVESNPHPPSQSP
jgi:hypothetical protein